MNDAKMGWEFGLVRCCLVFVTPPFEFVSINYGWCLCLCSCSGHLDSFESALFKRQSAYAMRDDFPSVGVGLAGSVLGGW